ncbi:MAG: hypothetical protein ISS71_05295 [Phycisphaerae bacterium]|nr:hypothetical protein [Phycisphaerae bacterium]
MNENVRRRESAPVRVRDERESEPLIRPGSARALRNWLWYYLGYSVPDRRVCGHHAAPMDYLWHAYSIDLNQRSKSKNQKYGITSGDGCLNRSLDYARDDSTNGRGEHVPVSGDCIVWANRAGGKTQLAAVATLLEGLFKPRCQTRILAGSLDQSSRMYEYLCEFVEHRFKDSLAGKMFKESCRFQNGATVQVLAQSARAVRGRHIHKLRCDEIEMFDEDVFHAAKFVTQSTEGHLAAMEMLSTMHRPYGLMQKLIENAPESGIPVYKWCMWEVIERCSEDRSCSRCPLNSDCGGKARRANGYLRIDDAISQMRRSSRAGFESEMLCLRPNLENSVFAEFDPDVHVRPVPYNPALPLYRAMDFGFTNPFVCLWIQVDGAGVVRVIDEYVQSRMRIAEHAVVLKGRTPCAESQVAGTFGDPAGAGHDGVSGSSEIKELARAGIRVKYRCSRILDGIEKIRAHLRAGDGSHRLIVDPGCKHLIEAMRCYHYPDAKVPSELPKKDGRYDHPIDALRYFFVNAFVERNKQTSRY